MEIIKWDFITLSLSIYLYIDLWNDSPRVCETTKTQSVNVLYYYFLLQCNDVDQQKFQMKRTDKDSVYLNKILGNNFLIMFYSSLSNHKGLLQSWDFPWLICNSCKVNCCFAKKRSICMLILSELMVNRIENIICIKGN